MKFSTFYVFISDFQQLYFQLQVIPVGLFLGPGVVSDISMYCGFSFIFYSLMQMEASC